MLDLKETVRFKLYSLLSFFSPYISTQVQFYINTKKFANLKDPKSFAEKLTWLKLNTYSQNELVKICSDKYLVRDYIAQCGYGYMLNELIGVYDDAKDIPWDALPNSFVLKWNFGSGFNLICKDKKTGFDYLQATKTLNKWKREPYWAYHSELQYRNMQKKILCERFLTTPDKQSLLDYKLYVFHGEVKAILVINREGTKSAVFMSPQWEYISDIPSRYALSFLPARPECLEEMISSAETIASPFPFVRMDYYVCSGKCIFGEMTFTPAACINPSEAMIEGKDMGFYVKLEAPK